MSVTTNRSRRSWAVVLVDDLSLISVDTWTLGSECGQTRGGSIIHNPLILIRMSQWTSFRFIILNLNPSPNRWVDAVQRYQIPGSADGAGGDRKSRIPRPGAKSRRPRSLGPRPSIRLQHFRFGITSWSLPDRPDLRALLSLSIDRPSPLLSLRPCSPLAARRYRTTDRRPPTLAARTLI
jgi:hypothetical protein